MSPPVVLAQGVQGSITGRVTDPSGAATPGVKVEMKNTGTNQTVTTVTDSIGQYTAPFLSPGTYSVTVEAPGFKKFVRENLAIQVGETITADVSLVVGSVTEALTVTAESPLLEVAKADRGTLVDQESVRELPLNGRNPFMLAKIVAGVNFNGTVIYQRPFDNGAIAQWTINGGLYQSNEFLLDGSPNNAQAGSNNIAYVPPVDAVQEFKIQTNSYDAQYGHTSGGIVNVSLKSGTNAFHGTVYEFARRKAWDANSFQNNAVGSPKGEHYLDQYGGQIAGPVYIPKVYNGKNKTFFLFDLREVSREHAASLHSLGPRAGICQWGFQQAGGRQRAAHYDLRPLDRQERQWDLGSDAVCRQHHSREPDQPDRQEYLELFSRAQHYQSGSRLLSRQLLLRCAGQG